MSTMKTTITTLLGFFMATSLFAQSGREIAQKVKNRPDGDSRQAEMSITLINKRGKKRVRKVVSYSIDVGKDKKTMMFFEYPGDVKGTGFLTYDYDQAGKEDDKWLYLPAMKKTRRISGASAKQDYFMGTDFTYDDMGSRSIDEDTHKLLGEENISGHKCWKVEYISKDSRDAYSKKVVWIRKDNLVAVKADYYDRNGKLQRQLTLSNIEKVDGFWIAKRLEMENVQTNHKTIIEVQNPKFNVKLDERKFIVNTLEKGKF